MPVSDVFFPSGVVQGIELGRDEVFIDGKYWLVVGVSLDMSRFAVRLAEAGLQATVFVDDLAMDRAVPRRIPRRGESVLLEAEEGVYATYFVRAYDSSYVYLGDTSVATAGPRVERKKITFLNGESRGIRVNQSVIYENQTWFVTGFDEDGNFLLRCDSGGSLSGAQGNVSYKDLRKK